MTEDKMVGWHHQLSGHELSKLWETVKDSETWTPGDWKDSAVVHGVAKSQT